MRLQERLSHCLFYIFKSFRCSTWPSMARLVRVNEMTIISNFSLVWTGDWSSSKNVFSTGAHCAPDQIILCIQICIVRLNKEIKCVHLLQPQPEPLVPTFRLSTTHHLALGVKHIFQHTMASSNVTVYSVLLIISAKSIGIMIMYILWFNRKFPFVVSSLPWLLIIKILENFTNH